MSAQNTTNSDMSKYPKIEITQVRSLIGCSDKISNIVKGLGLKRIRHTVVHKDNNCIRGMVNKVSHLVTYRIISEESSGKKNV